MRAASRLLASVQKGAQFLEAGTPTGLTGVQTHASPRTTLLYTYHTTLEKLKQFPEHSVYRQSVEALTKHRMQIVEQVKPAGLEEWQKRVLAVAESRPDAFKAVPILTPSGNKEVNIVWKAAAVKAANKRTDEWDDEIVGKPHEEGIRTEEERAYMGKEFARDLTEEERQIPRIESEPPLSLEQINEIETKIGAGLIEEVIMVAEGESTLCDTLLQAQVWEDLEEKPQDGQWAYHERDTFTKGTQAPPK
ncbi:hypothetical protein DOTSEDRAFT_161036 [Dothistroma septosporum NZE10]|uniref:Uncharacterized protein n=1 Tax=Dothistroma septosporum (strain NZE10 / CBS 128990) TaxID=675120 RepID=N1PBF7_DOTSN|nr:hypothetical protein DOTSEDRAFT_161036 [Dothistroma septosporum NZE10]